MNRMDDEKNFGPNFFRFPQIVPPNHVQFIRSVKEKKRKENRCLRMHSVVRRLYHYWFNEYYFFPPSTEKTRDAITAHL